MLWKKKDEILTVASQIIDKVDTDSSVKHNWLAASSKLLTDIDQLSPESLILVSLSDASLNINQ